MQPRRLIQNSQNQKPRSKKEKKTENPWEELKSEDDQDERRSLENEEDDGNDDADRGKEGLLRGHRGVVRGQKWLLIITYFENAGSIQGGVKMENWARMRPKIKFLKNVPKIFYRWPLT